MSDFEEKGPNCECGGETVSACMQDTHGWVCVVCDSFAPDDTPKGKKASNHAALASQGREFHGQ